jgi:hypothetical protein
MIYSYPFLASMRVLIQLITASRTPREIKAPSAPDYPMGAKCKASKLTPKMFSNLSQWPLPMISRKEPTTKGSW